MIITARRMFFEERLQHEAKGKPSSTKYRDSASGSLATFVSRAIFPDPSTTQTLLCYRDMLLISNQN